MIYNIDSFADFVTNTSHEERFLHNRTTLVYEDNQRTSRLRCVEKNRIIQAVCCERKDSDMIRDVRDQVFLVPVPVIPSSIGPGPNPGAFSFSGFRFGPDKVLFFGPGPGPVPVKFYFLVPVPVPVPLTLYFLVPVPADREFFHRFFPVGSKKNS